MPLPRRPKFPSRKPGSKNGLTYLLIIALILTSLYYIFNPYRADEKSAPTEKVSISEVIRKYKEDKIEKIEVEGNSLAITYTDGSRATAYKTGSETLEDLGLFSKPETVEVEIVSTESATFWRELLSSLIPFFLIVAFLYFMMRQVARSGSSALSFGKSRARIHSKEKKQTKFPDVAGLEEAKEDLEEIVDFLKNPQKYTQIGAKIPKGVLIIGPPGTGKTLLARAVAGEADVPFFSISGSEFVEMFVGVGASRVRDLFDKAKRNAPCIIFIDEIDAVGRQRGGAGFGGGHDEREQTLNQILTEMDGFESETNVIVVAATNRPDVLDSALLRPGRFDRRIAVDLPNLEARKAILEVHARNKKMSQNINLEKIARQTPSFSGADLENTMNEAAILAAKKGQKSITQKNIEQSVEKLIMGPERKSKVLSEQEKKITAFHEVGHALVAQILPNCDPIHKVSIISRGMALGVTWFLPEEDRHLYAKSKFFEEICALLGGYLAEKLTFGEVTTGASNDLERATKIAKKMVTVYGMSDKLGPVVYGETPNPNLPFDFGKLPVSEATSSIIDSEVKSIIEKALKKTEEILIKNKKKHQEIAEVLLKKEVLSADEFSKFFGGAKKAAAKKKAERQKVIRIKVK